MSKMDGLRAMREARYEQAVARAGKPVAPAAARWAPRPDPTPPAQAPRATGPEAPEPPPCGHRNMSGRTCTREQGHAAKSHRYS